MQAVHEPETPARKPSRWLSVPLPDAVTRNKTARLVGVCEVDYDSPA